MKSSLRLVLCAALMFVLSAAASGQNVGSGSISGVVKDTSGAVAPGVTVEVSSPALIERSKSAVTDGQGAYRIIDLRPGVYTVKFTATGFATVESRDIDLPSGFAATINGEMKVGSQADAVTVTGAAPVVDTQNVAAQKNFTRDVTQNLPLGNTVKAYATLIPGTNYNGGAGQQDVGGAKSEFQQGFSIHGGRADDFEQLRDGMFFGTMIAAGNWMTSLNPATVSEVTVHIGSAVAELRSGGAMINVVTRDGGNDFHGTVNGSWTNSSLQSNNVTDALRARAVTNGPTIRRRYDIGGGIGGPVIKDKLWFFGSTRSWETASNYVGNYANATPGTFFYNPDLSQPAYERGTYKEARLRTAWQATSKDRIVGMYGYEWNCNCPGTPGAFQSPETFIGSKYSPNYQAELTWTRAMNSHLLLEAGAVLVSGRLNLVRFGQTANDKQSINNLTSGYSYGNVGYGIGLMGSLGAQRFGQTNQTFAATYVNGSHTLKSGVTYLKGWRDASFNFDPATNSTSYQVTGPLNNPTPAAVVYYAVPNADKERMTTVSWFVQDQWKLKRLTINPGLRYDRLVGKALPVNLPAGVWVGARNLPEVNNVPSWNDWNVRVGAAYDVFGNGKTAIKAFVGRFVVFEPIGNLILQNAPVSLTVNSATRSWSDANRDFIPQESELGALSNANFGKPVQTTFWSDDVLRGNRPFNWQQSVQIDQQLWRGSSLSVAYFRRSYGNFRTVQNTSVAASDFSPYCVTAPSNTLLPGGGGNQICGLYDVNPAKFGQVNNLVTLASKFGAQKEVFNGIDVTFVSRLRRGVFVQAGFATGATNTDNCYLNTRPDLSQTTTTGLPLALTAAYTPRNSDYCRVSPPWTGNTQFKAAVVYPLPWKLQMSANYQNVSPISTNAQLAASNASIVPSLGRNLAACRAAVTCTQTQLLDVVLPNTYYIEPRVNQLDWRISRKFQIGERWTVQPNLDVFNVFNANSVQSINTRLGAAWRNVTGFLDPRVVRFSANVNF